MAPFEQRVQELLEDFYSPSDTPSQNLKDYITLTKHLYSQIVVGLRHVKQFTKCQTDANGQVIYRLYDKPTDDEKGQALSNVLLMLYGDDPGWWNPSYCDLYEYGLEAKDFYENELKLANKLLAEHRSILFNQVTA